MTTATATLTWNSLSPFITAAVTAAPRAKERPVKGAELLLAGHVQRLSVDRWLVYGGGGEPYNVSIHAGTCDCGDRNAPESPTGQKLCKHMYACMFGLRAGMAAPVEVAPTHDTDATLWQVEEDPNAILDAEVAGKVAELTAAGVDTNAEILVIGDWVWVVGDADADLMDSLGVKWHAKRGVHYWRPVWAAMDPEGFNEKKDLMGLAEKYGMQRHIPRRAGTVEKSAGELAMLLVPKINRDADMELWA